MKTQTRWVMWKYETVDKKLTKVPYTTTGRKASSTDPKTWTTYSKAKSALTTSKRFSGIGVIFTPDQKLLGIDLDHVLDKSTGMLKEEFEGKINHLLIEANTYTEISPSGEGLHLYLSINEPLPLIAHKKEPFEVYTDKRFFTYSDNSFHTTPLPIRTVTKSEAEAILSLTGYPWGHTIPSPITQMTTSTTDDEEILEHMFSSKNGEKVRSLYDGDMSQYNNDESRADAALLNHLAFWTQKNPSQMESIWLSSTLGKREKTQSRVDYRDRSIANAIAHCTEVYTPPSNGIDLLYALDKDKKRVYIQCTENICRILKEHPEFSGKLRYDAFPDQVQMYDGKKWVSIDDSYDIVLQTRISVLFSPFRKVGKLMVHDAMVKACKDNSIDSAVDFIKSIKWDGIARLDSWLTHTYGTPDDVYHRAVGANWIKGLVKRVMYPGCKFDYVLVLEGPQGSKKSTSLFMLGTINDITNWHVETTMSTDTKDFFEQFQGKAIIEFSEGETLSRTEVKKMKAIITTQVDRFRSSYGHFSTDHPRRCVFAMSTNQDQYLKDETGNRRWLPVKLLLDEANVEWLQENRDQLFAEAYHRVTEKKETVHEFPKEETLREQNMRQISDPNEERICHWYLNELSDDLRGEGITIDQVNQNALHSGFAVAMKKYEEMSIATVLSSVLRLKRIRRTINGVQSWRWFPVESVMSDKVASITNDIPFGN